jgi:Sulfotransferase domain
MKVTADQTKLSDRTVFKRAYRISTNWMRLMPDFMIIGAQKGGTTSLYRYLVDHPAIAPIYIKEPHYFDIHYNKGLGWYRSHFPTSLEKFYVEHAHKIDFITGEASPYYMVHPLAPARVAKLLSNVKLILVLRNPVDRAYSQYQHQLRQPGVEPLSFEEAIDREEERLAGEQKKLTENPDYVSFNHRHYSYLTRGRYVDYIPAWMKLFPKEQFLVLKSEDLYRDPSAILKETFAFLNVPNMAIKEQKEEYTQFNKASYTKLDPATRQRLVEYFKSYNARLYEFLGRDFGWDK